ncbi:hypothetical protein [Streptacidiphilus fuscans]|uniref:Secreted protein n=1 Tax=Streptacidiphilus fuscans TaxID=2789292 RepID=A0A931B446_9ACTN|nr:hypothetical protein [Streptacidiphilus fuscans]MBF9068337.1 hypothetical protein [Streptacidiphilus fuscans]
MNSSRLLRAVAGLALVGSLTGCGVISVGAGSTATPTTSATGNTTGGASVTSSTTSSTSSSSSASGTADAQALLGEMVPYPAGARPWAQSKTGAFGLSDFINNFYVPDARAQETPSVQRRGFTGAARHGWFTADGSQDEVWLVDFATDTGAQSMLLELSNSWKEETSSGAGYQDPGVNGMGMTNPTLDAQGNAWAKEAARVGRTLVYVITFAPATPDKAAAEALIKQQVGRVSG